MRFIISYSLFQVITQFDMAANPLWFNTNLSTKAALSCSKVEVLWMEIVRFAKQNFATHCESMACTSPLNTRIFASDFKFGEFHAILRGVFVKKIHNSSAELECLIWCTQKDMRFMLQTPPSPWGAGWGL